MNLAVNLLLLFLVVLWLALIYWTYADAKRRIADPMLVGCATVAALFPFVGTIVYMVVRPPEYLEDVHERELEIAAAEARLAHAHEHACPYCEYPVERAFLRCPSCLRRLKEPCATCGKPLDPRWKICPYCEAEVPARAAPAAAAQRAAARAAGEPRPRPRRSSARPRRPTSAGDERRQPRAGRAAPRASAGSRGVRRAARPAPSGRRAPGHADARQ